MKSTGIILSLSYACLLIVGCSKENMNTRSTGPTMPAATIASDTIDTRQAEQGSAIFQNNYIDQPYVVKLQNGNWLCTYTTSTTAEGGNFETIGVSISSNKGKTWSFSTYLEPPTNPVAFYGIPFITSFGRVYVIYGYNNNNILTLSGQRIRADAVGEMCYKYSDDNGLTWSSRQVINMPVTQYDLINNWQGKYSMWWTICKPILSSDNQMYFSFTKVAQYLYTECEGWVVNSPNINTEQDTSKIIWNFYPPGETGIRSATIGLSQQEHNIVQLNDGSFCCVFRTGEGYPAICYSQDNCKTWSVPVPITWGNNQLARNPVACARIFKFQNGNYVLWFENNNKNETDNRNPAWILGGIEANGAIKWSQPEVLLYSRDTTQRFSYPDMFQDGGNYYLTETQKTIARISTVNASLLNNLWQQGTTGAHSTQNLIADLSFPKISSIAGTNYVYSTSAGALTNGLSLNLNLTLKSFTNSGQTILSFLSGNTADTLIKVRSSSQQTIEVDIYDSGQLLTTFYCDNNLVRLNTPTFISIAMDPGSRVLKAMVNGQLCNGIKGRPYGWVIVPLSFNFSTISNNLHISDFNGALNELQIYGRPLTTGEMLSEYIATE